MVGVTIAVSVVLCSSQRLSVLPPSLPCAGTVDAFKVFCGPCLAGNLAFPLLLVGGLFLLSRRGGGAGGPGGIGGNNPLQFGKSKAKFQMEPNTGVTFDDVAGVQEAKEDFMEVRGQSWLQPASATFPARSLAVMQSFILNLLAVTSHYCQCPNVCPSVVELCFTRTSSAEHSCSTHPATLASPATLSASALVTSAVLAAALSPRLAMQFAACAGR